MYHLSIINKNNFMGILGYPPNATLPWNKAKAYFRDNGGE